MSLIATIKARRNGYVNAALALYLLMLLLTGFSILEQNLLWNVNDKLLHFGAYLLIALLLYLGLSKIDSPPLGMPASIVFTLLAIAFLAAFDEISQVLIEDRVADFDDWLFDLMGAVVVCSAMGLFGLVRKIWLSYTNHRYERLLEQVSHFENDPD